LLGTASMYSKPRLSFLGFRTYELDISEVTTVHGGTDRSECHFDVCSVSCYNTDRSISIFFLSTSFGEQLGGMRCVSDKREDSDGISFIQ